MRQESLGETLSPNVNVIDWGKGEKGNERKQGGCRNWMEDMLEPHCVACTVNEVHESEDLDENGIMRPKLLTSPHTPTKQERMEHDITHFPFRSWCEHCVRGKSKAAGHFYTPDKSENRIPIVGHSCTHEGCRCGGLVY